MNTNTDRDIIDALHRAHALVAEGENKLTQLLQELRSKPEPEPEPQPEMLWVLRALGDGYDSIVAVYRRKEDAVTVMEALRVYYKYERYDVIAAPFDSCGWRL